MEVLTATSRTRLLRAQKKKKITLNLTRKKGEKLCTGISSSDAKKKLNWGFDHTQERSYRKEEEKSERPKKERTLSL